MAISFGDLSTAAGLKELDAHLLTRSYISGYQASRDDLTVYAALAKFPTGHTNVERWYKHIKGLLGSSFPGAGVGVSIGGAVSSSGGAAGAAEPVAPPKAESKPAADEDDDDDLDLFGEATEEEKAAAAEREAKAKASGKQKEAGKSSVLLDVKPWDDETDMAKLEAAVRAVQMDGLTWGASKLVPVGYGIKKLTIMMTIVDDLVSIDALVEDHLTQGDCAEYVQSCDIVAFNKI